MVESQVIIRFSEDLVYVKWSCRLLALCVRNTIAFSHFLFVPAAFKSET